jgi:peptide/nickel transport system permease protein
VRFVRALARQLARSVAVVVLVTVGSSAMMRLTPGYLSDARELDAKYASVARRELAREATRNGSIPQVLLNEVRDWSRGSLGFSREYEIPVTELIVPRLAVTGFLGLRAIVLAWMLASLAALTAAGKRRIRSLANIRCPFCWRLPPRPWRRPAS